MMQAIGIVMMLLFLHMYFAPWHRFRSAVDQGHFPEAAKHLNTMRGIVAVNSRSASLQSSWERAAAFGKPADLI
jgi:hypothetical protein